MLLVHLCLIFIPAIAFVWARRIRSKYTWRITGLTFGAVAYPFFASLTTPLVYMGPVGHAIVNITNPIAIFHRAPGKLAYFFINGHLPNYRGFDDLWLIGLNAIIWGLLYGAIGWYFDRSPVQIKTKILLLLLAIPALYKVVAFGAMSVEVVNETSQRKKNFGAICREVINAKPNTDVGVRIGSLKGGFVHYRAVQGSQSCINVAVSQGPFQMIIGDTQDPQATFNISVSAGSKTCVGIAPIYKSGSPFGTEWAAKVIDCAR